MNIRIAQNNADFVSASAIHAKSWKVAYRGIFSEGLLADIPLDFWVNAFQRGDSAHRYEVAILSLDGEDIGAGGYGLSRNYEDAEMGEIMSFYFLEGAWGKGCSGHLMEFILGRLEEMGCKRVHLWVLEENMRARRFYERMGFLSTGNRMPVTVRGETQIDTEYLINV